MPRGKLGSGILLVLLATGGAFAANDTDPWEASDLVTAEHVNQLLPDVKAGKTVLIQVGFLTMYKMGHIPGSRYAGATARADGLAALKKLMANLPRHQPIIIYCGCCPWDDCPNIRPAFRALKEMGFTNFKVLEIPERLGTDWTAKGYPIVKGM